MKMLAHKEESDMRSNNRLDRLQKLLSETSKRDKLGPKARSEIKKLLHKIHGHYFNKLFNMLQPTDPSKVISNSDRSTVELVSPTADEVDAMAAELAAEDDDSDSDVEEDDGGTTRRRGVKGFSKQ